MANQTNRVGAGTMFVENIKGKGRGFAGQVVFLVRGRDQAGESFCKNFFCHGIRSPSRSGVVVVVVAQQQWWCPVGPYA